jgi:hypothetical protein
MLVGISIDRAMEQYPILNSLGEFFIGPAFYRIGYEIAKANLFVTSRKVQVGQKIHITLTVRIPKNFADILFMLQVFSSTDKVLINTVDWSKISTFVYDRQVLIEPDYLDAESTFTWR